MDVEPLVAPPGFKELYKKNDYVENDILHPGTVADRIDFDCYHSSEVRCQGKNGFYKYGYSREDGGRGELYVHDNRWGWRKEQIKLE